MTRSEKRDAILDGVARSMTASMIGRQLGCSRHAIIGFAYRNSIGLLDHPTGCTVASRAAPLRAEVVAVFLEGVTKPKLIAQRLKKSHAAVLSHLQTARRLGEIEVA